ncbi:aspartate/glutamate racemase family protein [Ruania alba]|uniref:Aspartate racemase n=1 Tax=Ruania alba TaxID=648782 RepID=A0A1H5LGG0_9MICO|nr:amino acid racemase [Ruania alba]SEE76074.1 aspartate racemase [Ruania alba]
MTSPLIGVLGGMGPAASVHFQARLVQLTPAERDADHPTTVVWSDPRVPDRVAALRGTGASPVPALRRGVGVLRSAGASVIAVPCNTVHPFLPEVLPPGGWVDMITTAAARLAADGATRVGVLATAATLEHGMYTHALAEHGIEAHAPADQEAILELIAAVKAGRAPSDLLARLGTTVRTVLADGCDAVLIACTELSVVAAAGGEEPGMVDALDELARETLRRVGVTPW